MKIVCDSCGAKYQIADEKVRGKVFKIRCKKCSNVIVVKGDAQQAEAEQPAGDGGEGAAKPGRSARRRRSRTRDRQDGGEGESEGGSDTQPTASEAASG